MSNVMQRRRNLQILRYIAGYFARHPQAENATFTKIFVGTSYRMAEVLEMLEGEDLPCPLRYWFEGRTKKPSSSRGPRPTSPWKPTTGRRGRCPERSRWQATIRTMLCSPG